MIEWVILGRQEGKTQRLIDWVKQANRTNSYPFWDRIILVASLEEGTLLRNRLRGFHPQGLEYNMVWHLDDFQTAMMGAGVLQVGIDNVEFLLGKLLANCNARTVLSVVTGTGDSHGHS